MLNGFLKVDTKDEDSLLSGGISAGGVSADQQKEEEEEKTISVSIEMTELKEVMFLIEGCNKYFNLCVLRKKRKMM